MAKKAFPEHLDVRVDFRKTIAQAIADAGIVRADHEFGNACYITAFEAAMRCSPYRSDTPFRDSQPGIAMVRLEAVTRPGICTTAEARLAIEKRGLGNALFEDMLAFAAARPDLVVGHDCVGLRSCWNRRVPKIEACGGGPIRLELGFSDPHATWPPGFIFLGVRSRSLIDDNA